MQRIEIIGNLAKDAVRVEGQDGGNPFMSLTVICNDRRGDAVAYAFWIVRAFLQFRILITVYA